MHIVHYLLLALNISISDPLLIHFCVSCEVAVSVQMHICTYVFLNMDSQLCHHHLKNLFLFVELPWHLGWKSLDHKCVGLFLDSLCFPLMNMSVLAGRVTLIRENFVSVLYTKLPWEMYFLLRIVVKILSRHFQIIFIVRHKKRVLE